MKLPVHGTYDTSCHNQQTEELHIVDRVRRRKKHWC